MEPGIRDCIYGRDAGFSAIVKRDPGNSHLKAPRSGISDGENFKTKLNFSCKQRLKDRKFKLSISITLTRSSSPSALCQTRLRWHELERCLLISTTEKCNQGIRSPLSRHANEMDEAAPEIKTTKKAFLSTICLAAMKIQKNSHLVMTTTKVTMMLVTFTNLWPARPTSFSERFLGLENYSSQQRVAEGVKTTRSNRLKFGLLKTLLDGCDCALSYFYSE